jgi:hypothetical protein
VLELFTMSARPRRTPHCSSNLLRVVRVDGHLFEISRAGAYRQGSVNLTINCFTPDGV